MKSVREATTSPSKHHVLLLAVVALLAAAYPLAGRAQSSSVPSTLAGTWVHHGDRARSLRTIDAAFAPALASLPEIMHGFARDRIRTDMAPPRRVLVSLEGAGVRVTLEGERTIAISGALGAAATASGVESGTRVTPRLQGGWLELLYEGESSQLRQLLSTEPDGSRLHLDITVVNPRLASPVRYRLDYARP